PGANGGRMVAKWRAGVGGCRRKRKKKEKKLWRRAEGGRKLNLPPAPNIFWRSRGRPSTHWTPTPRTIFTPPWYWSRSARAWGRYSYIPTKSASRRPTFEEIPDLKLPEQMEGLAETIIGHLHRLFVRHWGASPSAVAQTVRLQLAKRLLDTTI